MSEASKKANADKRKLEKQERKSANIAKVEETKKPKNMWEKLADDKAGTKVNAETGKEEKTTSRKKARVVKMENRLSHRRTRKRAKPVCVRKLGGEIVRVSHAEASVLVKAGASYVNKKVWRAWRDAPTK